MQSIAKFAITAALALGLSGCSVWRKEMVITVDGRNYIVAKYYRPNQEDQVVEYGILVDKKFEYCADTLDECIATIRSDREDEEFYRVPENLRKPEPKRTTPPPPPDDGVPPLLRRPPEPKLETPQGD